MKLMIEEKQVGNVSYFVSDPLHLINIIEDEQILRSRKEEYNPKTNKKQFYVSLSRNMTATAKRNSSRWIYGVIIDGTLLSNRYNIEPVSYMGSVTIKSSVSVKYIVAYDNDTYYLNLVNFPTIEISRANYNKIKEEIENLPEDFKTLKKLVYQSEGKRAVRGAKIKEKYLFNVPSGGLRLTTKTYPDIISSLQKDPNINEFEERIWLKNSELFVNIKGCIEKILLPKYMKTTRSETEEDLFNCILENNIPYEFY